MKSYDYINLAKNSINLYKLSINLCQIITINEYIFMLIRTSNLNYCLSLGNQIETKTKECIFHKIKQCVMSFKKLQEKSSCINH